MFGDTGASCHLRNTRKGMCDVTAIDEQIGGIGSNIRATFKGKLRCEIEQADGTSTEKVLAVKYCKDAQENLFSITQEMSKGATLGSDADNNMILSYPDESKIVFDRRIKTRDGWLGGVNVVPVFNDFANVTSRRSVNVNEYHKELGHPNEAITRATAKQFDIKLTGTFKPCENCALAKAKQKKISKVPKGPNKREKIRASACASTSAPRRQRVLAASAIGYSLCATLRTMRGAFS